MDQATLFEFKLLIAGVGLMITGAELLTFMTRVNTLLPLLIGGGSLFAGFVLTLWAFNYSDSSSDTNPAPE
ncbi:MULTISPECIES: hypothetical protein [Salinibaculum]|uniref:hypothetical protein n=1 Tax=Salinibaculum TaxID=2732368 RepID=UPI0030D62E48